MKIWVGAARGEERQLYLQAMDQATKIVKIIPNFRPSYYKFVLESTNACTQHLTRISGYQTLYLDTNSDFRPEGVKHNTLWHVS